MKKVIIILLFLLSLNIVFASNDTILLNTTFDNPWMTTSLLLEGEENLTIFVNLTNVDTRLNISYNESIYFENNDSIETGFNVSSDYNFIVAENITSNFSISNDKNNNTANYSIKTIVYVENLLEEEEEDFLELKGSTYVINLSTTLLPKSGYLDYSLLGNSGEVLYLTCDDWLVCPESKIFDANNETSFRINYDIPDNTNSGEYQRIVEFRTGNLSTNSIVEFNIKQPSISFKEYELDESCYVRSESGEEAIKYSCYIDYNVNTVTQMQQAYEFLQELNNETCIAENKTEYVYSGNISEDLKSQYDLCLTERDLYHSQVTDKNSLITSKEGLINDCQVRVDQLNKKILRNETDCLQNAFEYKAQLQDDYIKKNETLNRFVKEERKKTVGVVWKIIISIITCFIIFFWYRQTKRNGWKRG